MEWQKPYSPPGYPVLYYTGWINDVYSFNETVLLHKEALSANFTEECMNNNFTLTATNAIGDSEPVVYVLSLLKGNNLLN